MTSPIQYFLFDFDGVLADSEIHTLPTIERVAANYNLTWGKLRQEYGGWTWHAIADELLATTVSNAAALPPVDVLADELATAFSEAVLSAPISVHGAIGAVRAASKVGRVAVVTGSRGPLVEAWLQHFHVRDCVELIVGAESYERAKPAPDAYQTALRRLAANPSDAIVFEDSPAGVAAAVAADLRVYLIGETSLPETLGTRILGQFVNFKAPGLIRRLRDENGLMFRANAE